MITLGGMDHIVDRDVFVKQAAMCIVIAILPAEEETAAALRIQIPEQHAHTSFCKKAGQVYGCGGFPNSTFDIINGNLFQKILAGFSEVETNHKKIKPPNNCSLLSKNGQSNSNYY